MEFSNLAKKYVAQHAQEADDPTQYERLREGTKWQAENEAAEALLAQVPARARTLDVPIGTGRLIPALCARSFDAHGMDISPDMLGQAKLTAERLGFDISLSQGDVRHLPFEDEHFDLVSCLRFLNWIDDRGVETVLRELTRVSRDKILIGIRYYTPLTELKSAGLRIATMRLLGVPRWNSKRWKLVYHTKAWVHRLFTDMDLNIDQSILIERRWDGTDYSFYLLSKAKRSQN